MLVTTHAYEIVTHGRGIDTTQKCDLLRAGSSLKSARWCFSRIDQKERRSLVSEGKL